MHTGIVEPRPGVDVGRVVVPVRVENAEDRRRADAGEIPPARIRHMTVEALVDSGATFLCLPGSLIQAMGLPFHRVREARTGGGITRLGVYSGAHIEVQGRARTDEVTELPEGQQPLLGQIPLETLDWWVDPSARRLVGNPEHGGQWMVDVF